MTPKARAQGGEGATTLCGRHLPKDQAWDGQMFLNPQISTGPAQDESRHGNTLTEGVTVRAA